MALADRIKSLLGISTYSRAVDPGALDLGSPAVEAVRKAMGGQLSPPPRSETRWYLSDLEAAEHGADSGNLELAAMLMNAARKDGVLAGVLSTRTDGLVALPKRFRGNPEIVSGLELGHDSIRSEFDELCPPQELALLAGDGILLGVGVAELIPVEGRDTPVLVRLNPQYLTYRWNENRWYYRSIAGTLPITPGDGRWVLYAPGGRFCPWNAALWKAVARAFITKEHALQHKANFESGLAWPARIAKAPNGANAELREAHLSAVAQWGINTVFSLSPGYDIELLESNGQGYESFAQTIEQQNEELIIAIAGQVVTTSGGTGFANADIHKSIRSDLIQSTADALAYTINTQVLPAFIAARWGVEALSTPAVVEWDVSPPKDRAAEAQSLLATAQAISQLSDALARFDRQLDVDAIAARFGIPIAGDLNGDGKPDALPAERPRLALVQGGAE